MNTKVQTLSIPKSVTLDRPVGITSTVVISTSLVTLGITVLAAAWQVAIPVVGLAKVIALALA